MNDMSYYVVEVSFRKTNPIHRAICFHRSRGNIRLFGSYEDVIEGNVKQLTHFEVVEEISSMTENYPNQHKLPL